MYFAHSVEDQDRARWQGLADHLLNVSELAAARSSKFGAGRLGALSGMLHDLGKYTEGFQAYIAGNGESVDHSTAGAQEVLRMVSGQDGIAAQLTAYGIAGHHSGLPDRISETSSLSDRLKKALPPLAADWKNEISPDATTLSPLGFKLHIDQPSLRPFQLAMLVAFDGLTLSPCYETMSLQVGLVGRDGVLVPFKANARHIRNVKQSVTDFIGPL